MANLRILSTLYVFLFALIPYELIAQKTINQKDSLRVYIKEDTNETFTFTEFLKFDSLRLTNSDFRVHSYIAYFSCDYNLTDKKTKLCDEGVSTISITGNSLKEKEFIELLKKYQNLPFKITLDMLEYIDETGSPKFTNLIKEINILVD